MGIPTYGGMPDGTHNTPSAPNHDPDPLPILRHCPRCGNTMWAAYHNYRTITTLTAVLRLTLKIRRCITPACPQFQQPYRPEAEGRLALPKHEFGLDVIVRVGALRYAHHRSLPEIHQELRGRRMLIAPRTVQHLLERYDELVALSLADPLRLQQVTQAQGRVILALDGLQPDVGHEVLWVLRDCLSAEVLLARSMLSATQDDLADLLCEVKQAIGVPIVGVISDGQPSIRCAVATVLPDVPHQLCHFHYLREAAKPVYEADRHAKKELKKRLRGVRPIERQLDKRTDPAAVVMRGYCSAVRSALTDDGHPPLAAAGLTLHDRLSAISQSLERGAKKGALPTPLVRLQAILQRGLTETASLWPDVRVAYRWVHRVAHVLTNEKHYRGATVKRRLGGLLGAMTRHQDAAGALAPALAHFRKVTRSYWPGLFHCYEVPSCPGPITTWSNTLVPIATTNGGPQDVKAPLQPWCCVARSSCSLLRPHGCTSLPHGSLRP